MKVLHARWLYGTEYFAQIPSFWLFASAELDRLSDESFAISNRQTSAKLLLADALLQNFSL